MNPSNKRSKMKILLTGANGYIGKQLLPILIEKGHHVTALVRQANYLWVPKSYCDHVHIIEGDLLNYEKIAQIPQDIEIAYYLVHSMKEKRNDFKNLEVISAKNFVKLIQPTTIRQVIYLSGLISQEKLSFHLDSRKSVENILRLGNAPVTVLRAGIIIGSGSASFEIMRDLVEKLPIMIAPKWLRKKIQPIGIDDVLDYLISVIDHPQCLNDTFDIGGPDEMSYREMLMRFAKMRGLRRHIITIPVLTPKLSSYWLYFMTKTNFRLAKALVESLKNNIVCNDHRIKKIIPKTCLNFEKTLDSIFLSKNFKEIKKLDSKLLQEFKFGCITDLYEIVFQCQPNKVKEAIWRFSDFYHTSWAWKLRGFIDLFFGGPGLRRGRTHPHRLNPGDTLDFWQVLIADEKSGRLLLYCEMLIPGEAWLNFEVIANKNEKGGLLRQKVIFRPKGLLGRLYWYAFYPLHFFLFSILVRKITCHAKN